MNAIYVRVDDSDAAFEAGVEVALSSTASEDLGLHDHVIFLCYVLV